MRKPTNAQRIFLKSHGEDVPASRIEAGELVHDILNKIGSSSQVATVATLQVIIAEQRDQIRDLQRLVRYQKLHIAKILAGEDVPE